MKVNMINSTSPHLKGLWGKDHFTHSESLYGGEFDCNYYQKPYHPCKDETHDQIQFALRKKQQELDILNKASAMNATGNYVGVTVGKPLKITTQELAHLHKDSKNIINGRLPEHNLDMVM